MAHKKKEQEPQGYKRRVFGSILITEWEPDSEEWRPGQRHGENANDGNIHGSRYQDWEGDKGSLEQKVGPSKKNETSDEYGTAVISARDMGLISQEDALTLLDRRNPMYGNIQELREYLVRNR